MQWSLGLVLAASTLAPTPAEPVPVSRGNLVEPCGWPAVASIGLQEGAICTGTLIHPELVVFAAHCVVEDVIDVGFGESITDPEQLVQVRQCVAHPDFVDRPGEAAHDLAFCTLAAPVTQIPIARVAGACEYDGLERGDEVVSVGYGRPGGKRWGATSLGNLGPLTLDVAADGTGPCLGDSGGPAMVHAPDGGWSVLGVASLGDGACQSGLGIYARLDVDLDWIEETSGLTIGDCGGSCNYANAGPEGTGLWSNWCTGTPVHVGDACGESGSSDDGGEAGSGAATASDDGGSPSDTGAHGESGTDGADEAGRPTGGTSGTSQDSSDGGCREGQPGTWMLLPLLALLAPRRRR